MLSVDSPQSVEKTVQTEQYETLSEQLTAMKLKEPVVESGVPVDVRDAIKQCYGLEEDAKFFVLPDNPNKLFVFHRGRLRTINLLTWKAFQQGDISLSNDEIKLNPETPSDDNEMDGQVAPPTTPVTPFRPMSLERCKLPNRFDWQKSMSDRERQYLQKERRRSTAFKTSLCNEFRITGSCSYGVSCRFAHGEIELRPVPGPHPKYKTQLCNKFALYGSCPYGARCQFIHMRPCEARNDDYSGRLNFSGSFDGCSNYRYRFDGRLGYYVCEPPGPQCCVMFPEQFMPSNGLPEISSVGLSPHQFTPNTFWPHPSSSQVLQSPSTDSCFQGTFMLPVSSSNMLNSSAAKVDDFFTTLSTGEMSNPFTQSCFPRINLDGSSLNNATVTDSNIQANFVSND